MITNLSSTRLLIYDAHVNLIEEPSSRKMILCEESQMLSNLPKLEPARSYLGLLSVRMVEIK